MGKLAGVAVLVLVGGCYLGKDGHCDPGPFFSGPMLTNPKVAAAGDRLLVQWQMYEEPDTRTQHGAMLASDGTVVPGSRFDFADEQDVQRLTSGPDRVLVQGLIGHDVNVQRPTFMEIRLATGERQGAPIAGVSGYAAFDGDAFLVGKGDGTAVRVALDGTVSAPLAIPPGLTDLAPLATVTWAVSKTGTTLTASRIARGGGVIDAAPRLVVDGFTSYLVASRPTEAAIVTQDPDGVRRWSTLLESGTISAAVPLNIDIPSHWRPLLLAGERDGYLLVLDNFGDYDFLGVHISPTGIAESSFVLLTYYSSALQSARSGDRTWFVYGPVDGVQDAPRIEALSVEPGAEAGDPQLVETVEGETYTVDCTCNAGGGSSGLLVVLAFVLTRRCRRPGAGTPGRSRGPRGSVDRP